SALLNGDQETGVSIVRMAKKVDTGEILAQKKIPIPKDMMYPWLEQECSTIGAGLLLETLDRYGRITPTPQDAQQASVCKKFSKEDGRIFWKKETAEQIFNKYRAFDPWPGVFTLYQEKILKLVDIGFLQLDSDVQPGFVFQKTLPKIEAVFLMAEAVKEQEPLVCVKAIKGAVVLFTVQQEGKKKMDVWEFVRGHKDFIGTML
ncbi:hypothetical protein HZA41_01715, partial [Candidatus Peregrinibacteria bacterium]|nr:hypothetical protein [Candidatus Peregrinibacteria bacterium]